MTAGYGELITDTKERRTARNRRRLICAVMGICMSAALTTGLLRERLGGVRAEEARLQRELAEEVFRFHVLAHSDSSRDQEIKLSVRDAVLAYMKENMGSGTTRADGEAGSHAEDMGSKPESADGAAGSRAESIGSAADTEAWARAHLEELEAAADEVLMREGADYRAKARVTVCDFPEKRYGDITFPAGRYEALRIELGDAAGHNWWCVLYPNLCFIDAACAVVSEEGKEELAGVLDEEAYELVTAPSDFKIKWFFFGKEEACDD